MQFTAPIFYLDEAEGYVEVGVMRMGSRKGQCSVHYCTADGSAKEGDVSTITRVYKRLSEPSCFFLGSSPRAQSGGKHVELSEMTFKGSYGGSKFGSSRPIFDQPSWDVFRS